MSADSLSTDLVSRLRNHEGAYLFPKKSDELIEEAADEIERLEAFAASCIAAGGANLGKYQRAILCLQEIAALAGTTKRKQAGCEMAAHMLAQLKEPREAS